MHDTDVFHLHELSELIALEQSHPLWRADRIILRSVGIDIGSSTSHLIFSTLELRRQSAVLSSRFELVDRHIDFASDILLTPFVAGESLDVQALSAFLQSTYAKAGIRASAVDTGAVITTGDAARKDNAESVVRLFSEHAGKFVCASAGPLLEAKMAAYGSGAVARSASVDSSATVLNIDVGGGTSKLAIARNGRVIEATAIDVGARLITFDKAERLTKIERAAAITAKHCGLSLQIGTSVREPVRRDLAAALADVLLEVAARGPLSDLARTLMLAEPLRYSGDVDVVMFSGGVSEYFYHLDIPRYGDLGPQLARFLRQRLAKVLPGLKLERPSQGIRATVIGASQFTAQVSGNTLYIGDPGVLPLRNLQVVPVDVRDGDVTAESIAQSIRDSLIKCEADVARPMALAVRWPHGPAYAKLFALADGIAQATERLEPGLPIVLVLDVDVARLTGTILSKRTNRRILCIDGIDLHEFDYIDISEEHAESHVVTVIVKSLIFTG